MTRDEVRENMLTGNTWLRGFFILLYAFVCYVAIWIVGALALFQFGIVLLSGKPNERLLYFGHSLGIFIYQILLYITYSSDEKPFPFSNWPNPSEYNTEPVVNLPKESEPPPKN
ncbi:MAG: hypothetical protein DRR08_12925 [Candidatus Parabeggiatoa sp. nov. 2]|nr:MAG: hypothetical protein B6247_18200 [Beggiatoa sp. 4572_84]RKZ59812.1 MAG: hypothetical protein DRR08_12925 [Gammaproteobacteria bacterium]HEC83856.1 DUF4389 domain-containing protein [Thioploca sp.]